MYLRTLFQARHGFRIAPENQEAGSCNARCNQSNSSANDDQFFCASTVKIKFKTSE